MPDALGVVDEPIDDASDDQAEADEQVQPAEKDAVSEWEQIKESEESSEPEADDKPEGEDDGADKKAEQEPEQPAEEQTEPPEIPDEASQAKAEEEYQQATANLEREVGARYQRELQASIAELKRLDEAETAISNSLKVVDEETGQVIDRALTKAEFDELMKIRKAKDKAEDAGQKLLGKIKEETSKRTSQVWADTVCKMDPRFKEYRAEIIHLRDTGSIQNPNREIWLAAAKTLKAQKNPEAAKKPSLTKAQVTNDALKDSIRAKTLGKVTAGKSGPPTSLKTGSKGMSREAAALWRRIEQGE